MAKENVDAVTPDPFSQIGLYGDRDVFQKKLDAGFLEVEFIGGPWIGNNRLVGGFAFHNVDGQVSVEATMKGWIDGGGTMRGQESYEFDDQDDYQNFQEEWQLKGSNRASVQNLLEKWAPRTS